MSSAEKLEVKQVAVIGNGWSALASVGFLVSSGINVHWITGSGARVLFPLSSMEWGPGVHIFRELIRKFNIECGDLQTGSWLREFRNKAFREPNWIKAPTPEARMEVRNELLWPPEYRIAGVFEAHWNGLTPAELEEEIRQKLQNDGYTNLSKVDGVPVQGLFPSQQGCTVRLATGVEIQCEQVIYADRWSLLIGMDGMPKSTGLLRKREPMGVLQASFSHEAYQHDGPLQSFYSVLHRSGANELERRVWGHFSSNGSKSIWTLCLAPEEFEDNHEIAKKFRRLKGTLDKMFQGSDLIPAGKQDFVSTVLDEQVRFEEEAIFADSEVVEEPIQLTEAPSLVFLTDGYGPTRAFQQVGAMLGIQIASEEVTSKEAHSEKTESGHFGMAET
jgi:hypothetical protein